MREGKGRKKEGRGSMKGEVGGGVDQLHLTDEMIFRFLCLKLLPFIICMY